MKDKLEEWLIENKVLRHDINETVQNMIIALDDSIPKNMKLNIAHAMLTKLATEFQVSMALPDGSKIPTNGVFFSLSPSGNGKDSSEQKCRRMLDDAYEMIEDARKKKLFDRAIAIADMEGFETEEETRTFIEKFLKKNKIKPLFVSTSTEQGLVKYLNELEGDMIGSGYLFSGEIGTELITSQDIVSNIKLISEVFDSGQKKIRVLKSEENQSGEISFMPFNALLMSSPEVVLYDEEAKKKFIQEFISKLARRSWFNYTTEKHEKSTYLSVDEFLVSTDGSSNKELKAMSYVKNVSSEVSRKMLERWKANDGVRISMDIPKEVWDIFNVYKEYNSYRADECGHKYPISEKEMKHRQWKVLKLAGSLAIINHPDDMTLYKEDYSEAVAFVEMLNGELALFEDELRKEQYEVFADYMMHEAKESELEITIHELISNGFIKSSGANTKIKELSMLANSVHKNGVFYVTADNGIRYEPKQKPKFGASYVKSEGTKEERGSKCSEGFKYKETSWDKLPNLVSNDLAYTMFEFKDGKRANANITSGTSWIVLDIDDSDIEYTAAADMLQDYESIIATTSNRDNPYKFRVLIKLDQYVDIDSSRWKKFIKYISNDLALETDLLPKSQIYYGYKDSIVIVNEGEEYPADPALIYSSADEEPKKEIPKKEAQGLLANKFQTFDSAFDAEDGKGSISLVAACYYAMELGANIEYITELAHEVNLFWENPMSEERLYNTVIKQFERKLHKSNLL